MKKAKNKKQKASDSGQGSMINEQQTANGEGEAVESKEEVKEVIKEVEVEVEVNVDYKDKWMRAQADYQNLVKETNEKRSEWAKLSEVQILEEFIPVYDNFKKAFGGERGNLRPELRSREGKPSSRAQVEGGESDSWAKGIEYIMKQFGDILKSHGIEEVETVGKTFDPSCHEAVGEEESEEYVEGTVVKELDAGYKIKDKVIKVAKVILAK